MTVIAVVSDLHAGSSHALADPDSLLERWDDARNEAYSVPVELNPAQEYLYEIYRWGMSEIAKLAGKRPLHLIVNGDMTQGDRFKEELSFPLVADQVQIASDLICRWKNIKTLKSIRITKSTRVHAFEDGQADTAILNKVRAVHKDTRLVGHGQLEVAGVLLDYAHHGPPAGVRSWLKGNLMRYYLKSLMDTALKDGLRNPDAVLRAHKHERVEEWVVDWRGDERVKTLGITTPSFQLLGSHAQKATLSNAKVTNGMLALDVEDGRIREVHWFAKTKQLPVLEAV